MMMMMTTTSSAVSTHLGFELAKFVESIAMTTMSVTVAVVMAAVVGFAFGQLPVRVRALAL